MDSTLPEDLLSAMAGIRVRDARARRGRTRLLVSSGRRRHPIMELTGEGFVIEADGLPRLRGYVDILRGDERIARRLAQFAWARDGLVAYEFKLDGGAREVAADYELPEHRALPGPSGSEAP